MKLKQIVIAIAILPVLMFGFISNKISVLNTFVFDISCDQKIEKTAFDICYSYNYKHPKVVVYTLNGDKVNKNNFKRGSYFKEDNSIPKQYRTHNSDYYKSGLDKGHNAPNSAFDYNKTIQKETFLLSNITPQYPSLNRHYWSKIEDVAKLFAVLYGKVEMVTGSCGEVGKINNNVSIPKYFFKVIYAKKSGYIAFLVPNTKQKMSKVELSKYVVTIREIKEKCQNLFLEKQNIKKFLIK